MRNTTDEGRAKATFRWKTLLPGALVLLGILVGAHGFFDRRVVFHDEIINTFKATDGTVFDYAGRPAFYLMNVIWVKLFGPHPMSLIAGSLFYYSALCLVICQLGVRFAGLTCGVIATLIFLSSRLPLTIGIQAMPHLGAGFFSLCALLLLFRSAEAQSTALRITLSALAGFGLVLVISFHPTLLGFSASLLFLCAILVVGGRFVEPMLPSTFPRRVECIGCLLGFLASFVALNVMYLIFHEMSYVEVILNGVEKVADPQYTGYYQPWSYYWLVLFAEHRWLVYSTLAALAFVVLDLVWTRASRPRFAHVALPLIVPSVALTGSIVVISFAQWKFSRVLVAFIPLFAVFSAAWIVAGYDALRRMGRSRLGMIGIALVVLTLASHMVENRSIVEHRRQKRMANHQKYTGLYEAIALLGPGSIGYIGPSEALYSASRWTRALGRPLKFLCAVDACADGGRARLRALLDSHRADYILLNTDPGSSDADTTARLQRALRRLGGNRTYQWRGLAEVWDLRG